jgi:2-oxoglutarate ferredoxin oxidoreductase subunit alpha
VKAFCDAHDRVFVVEQNRDAQMRSLLMLETGVEGDKLIAAINFDGMPLTAEFVRGAIRTSMGPIKVAAE